MKVTIMRLSVIYLLVIMGHLVGPHASIASDNSPKKLGIYPILNAKYSYPQEWSGEIGVILGQSNGNSFASDTEGVYLSVEPGAAGTRANLGYGFGGSNEMGMMGYRIGASYYRPSKDKGDLSKDDNCVGVQVSGALMLVSTSVAAYYNLDSEKVIFSIGIGLGW